MVRYAPLLFVEVTLVTPWTGAYPRGALGAPAPPGFTKGAPKKKKKERERRERKGKGKKKKKGRKKRER